MCCLSSGHGWSWISPFFGALSKFFISQNLCLPFILPFIYTSSLGRLLTLSLGLYMSCEYQILQALFPHFLILRLSVLLSIFFKTFSLLTCSVWDSQYPSVEPHYCSFAIPTYLQILVSHFQTCTPAEW